MIMQTGAPETHSRPDAKPFPRPPGPEAPADDPPFGASRTRTRAALRWTMYAGLPVVALVAVYLVTRSVTEPARGPEAHSSGGASPVMLTAEQARRIGVTYAVATRGPLRRDIRSVGQVAFDETRVKTISLRFDGWVEQLFADFTGQSLTIGAPLLAIYSPMLVTAQEELLLAGRLLADMSGGSVDARRNAEELLVSARRRLSQWEISDADIASVETSGRVRRTYVVRAPVGGFVVEKNVLEGQRVMAGERLYRVADLSVVWLEGEVFEQDLPLVSVGQRAVAELDALPGQRFGGRVSYIYPTFNSETRTARVRVEIANPGLRLKPGMYATLRLTSDGHPSVLSVPRSAVLSTGERHLVFVKRADGMLETRLVVLGNVAENRIEILRGIAAGDTVVASATFLVDAESNLGTALGGMGNMPGMNMTAPGSGSAPTARSGAP